MSGLVERSNRVLRQKAKEVPVKDINSPKIRELLKEMKKSLHEEDDGVAIAAPQVGANLRIFIVSGRVFELKERNGLYDEEIIDSKTTKKHKDLVFINPKILKTSKDSAWMIEGCLSLRWLYGNVYRKKKVTIEAYNEKGEKFIRGASGLLAQIFQHENDHLEGILFIDKAKNVEDIPPELQKK